MPEKKELVRRPQSGSLFPWKPFREMQELNQRLSRAMDGMFTGDGFDLLDRPFDAWGGRTWAPAVDVKETEKEYIFEVELPGLEKDDFKVEMQEGMLAISGERKEKEEEKGKNYIRHEQFHGAFRRTFSMPNDAQPEGIKAAYKNGILRVVVQRSESAKPKAVPVKVE